jgi:hypothetical protein
MSAPSFATPTRNTGCYWGTDMTGSFDKASYRHRVRHFTETLDFLSEEDKDWVMGRAIMAWLKWA